VRAPPFIFILTLQRYEYLIAVFECFPNYFYFFFSVRCSVAVLQFSKGLSHTSEIMLYYYIYNYI